MIVRRQEWWGRVDASLTVVTSRDVLRVCCGVRLRPQRKQGSKKSRAALSQRKHDIVRKRHHRNVEVFWSRTFPNTPSRIVVRAVTRTKPSPEIARAISDRDAAQMRPDSHQTKEAKPMQLHGIAVSNQRETVLQGLSRTSHPVSLARMDHSD